ncbi:DUF3261 domain-containing protein [Budviciaceae bacterium BWR-B9]|uniref:DUF3261 domain-containing protein n=1 Tax=Limnobaculum allomyrinae TaxID=2791986 RepID=A0ABS1IPZ8_9GAMM|nr:MULTISPECIES: DUF3261 domain-containing protein [Limnobaculum]MBK5143777.1 DUF3261 domain-containing protein [Limnobaculum allomyrinae]MBV7693516.1 DUF3261 domain-containing protein [Limnobaculum sp. M2-1]
MKITTGIITTCLILLLSGCSLSQDQSHPQAWLKRGTKVTLPAPTLTSPLHYQQLLTATVEGKSQSMLVLLDADQEKITLAALSPVGIRLFKLTYDATGIHTEQSISLPQLPPAEQVLADIMLSYWPIADWQAHLPEGWQLNDQQNQRILTDNKGNVISEIQYLSENNRREPILITQHHFGYQISIQNVDTSL